MLTRIHGVVRRLHEDERGAAMVEYAIVTAVIAVVALTAAQANRHQRGRRLRGHRRCAGRDLGRSACTKASRGRARSSWRSCCRRSWSCSWARCSSRSIQHARNVADTAAAEGARLGAAEGHTLLEGAERTREVLASRARCGRCGLLRPGGGSGRNGGDRGERPVPALHPVGERPCRRDRVAIRGPQGGTAQWSVERFGRCSGRPRANPAAC